MAFLLMLIAQQGNLVLICKPLTWEVVWGTLLLAACGGGGSSATNASVPAEPELSAQAALGEKIFADTSLSASGRQACASCHSANNAHSPANSLATQLGGALLDLQGRRSAPSLNYLSFNAAFRFDAEGTPTGGFFWDGRAATLQEQAAEPFVNPFGKYDEFLRGNTNLAEQEKRGLALFNNPNKGNCAGCHPSGKGADGSLPLFTDFSYDKLGVPRNPAIARNADPAYFDLGLCERTDLAARTDLCGAFKVPSLRNVAERHAYFHNGRFSTLKDALTFYVQRDTNPEKWYPAGTDGTVQKFDDLPPQYRANVNTTEVPYNRQPGDAPALSDAEVDDVIAFPKTLSDGHRR